MSDLASSAMGRRAFLTAAALAAAGAAARPLQAAEGDGLRFVCTTADCAPYVYDPAAGNPSQGVAPGTPFSALPDSWHCPNCGSAKTSFIPLG